MVKLFTQAGCGMCKSVHMMLDKNKIEYEDIEKLVLLAKRRLRQRGEIK